MRCLCPEGLAIANRLVGRNPCLISIGAQFSPRFLSSNGIMPPVGFHSERLEQAYWRVNARGTSLLTKNLIPSARRGLANTSFATDAGDWLVLGGIALFCLITFIFPIARSFYRVEIIYNEG